MITKGTTQIPYDSAPRYSPKRNVESSMRDIFTAVDSVWTRLKALEESQVVRPRVKSKTDIKANSEKIAHSATTGLLNDDHPQYVLENLLFDTTAPTDITAGATADTGSASTAVRRDHVHGAPATWAATAHNLLSATHGDTVVHTVEAGDLIRGTGEGPSWTVLPITVPAANILNVLGVANGETEFSWKELFDSTNPAALAATAAPGTSLLAAHRDHVHPLDATLVALAGITAAANKLIICTGADAFSVANLLTGDVAAVDNEVVRWDGVTGIKLQGGYLSYGDTGIVTLKGATGTDTIVIQHDETNAYVNWSDGDWIFRSTEGVDAMSLVEARGNGAGTGQFRVTLGAMTGDFYGHATAGLCLYSSTALSSIFGQLSVGNIAAAATSASLDLNSTTGALLLNRLTTAQLAALTPSNGMLAYQATLNQLQGYINGGWRNLGLVIGTDVQAYDADLTAIAALAGTGILCHTAANTWAERTITSTCGLTVNNAGGVAGNIDIGLTTDAPQLGRLGLGAVADAAAKINAVSGVGANMIQYWHADNSTDNNSKWRVQVADTTGTLSFSNYYNGASYTDWFTIAANGEINLSTIVVATGITHSGMTASRLMYTTAGKAFSSVTDLTAWVAGTANRVTVANDGDGTITLSGPQDIHTAATPQWAQLGIGIAVADANLITAYAAGNAVTRTVSNGSNMYGSYIVEAGSGAVQGTFMAYGSTYVYGGTLFGVDPKGYVTLTSNLGLLIGTASTYQVIIGTNGAAAVTVSATQTVTCASTLQATRGGFGAAPDANHLVKTYTAVNGKGVLIDSDATHWGALNLASNGTVYALVGAPVAGGDIITGSAIGDLCIRSQGKSIRFSGDSGATIHATMSAAGAWTMASTLQATGLSVGRAATQLLDVYSAAGDSYGLFRTDATNKAASIDCVAAGASAATDVYLSHYAFGTSYSAGTYFGQSRIGATLLCMQRGSAMLFGTLSNTPLYIGTNDTAAITISTAQAVTCASTLSATDLYNSVAWTDYFASSTITGWAASPTGTIYYKRIGKTVVVSFYITGTSNAATAKFTLPVAAHASYPTYYTWAIRAVNNGTAQATPGMARLSPAGSTTLVECVLAWNGNPATGDFTTSGIKQIMGTLIYEAAS